VGRGHAELRGRDARLERWRLAHQSIDEALRVGLEEPIVLGLPLLDDHVGHGPVVERVSADVALGERRQRQAQLDVDHDLLRQGALGVGDAEVRAEADALEPHRVLAEHAASVVDSQLVERRALLFRFLWPVR
jgi:hypothetical protein